VELKIEYQYRCLYGDGGTLSYKIEDESGNVVHEEECSFDNKDLACCFIATKCCEKNKNIDLNKLLKSLRSSANINYIEVQNKSMFSWLGRLFN
jgi:hypothetical protein